VINTQSIFLDLFFTAFKGIPLQKRRVEYNLPSL